MMGDRDKKIILKFITFYLKPAFGSRSKSEIDLKVFELLREYNYIGSDYYEVARRLKITPARARNFLINSELRLKSETDTTKEYNEFISKIDKLGYKTDAKDNRVIMFSIPNALLREQLKYRLRRINKGWDSSFNSELVKVKIDDFLELVVDENLRTKIATKKVRDVIVGKIIDCLQSNPIGSLGMIIKLILSAI